MSYVRWRPYKRRAFAVIGERLSLNDKRAFNAGIGVLTVDQFELVYVEV
jgi:hypothetical protein